MKEACILLMCVIGVLAKFPPGFKFGASSSAFQIEGAWLDDDKSPSVWDDLAHMQNFTEDGMAPDVGAESYYRYPEDIEYMKQAGIKHYRLSISWPRIVPRGRVDATVNKKAIDHYRKMLTAFVEAGITPYVTLFHGDLPVILSLQDYGYVDRYFADNFAYYADVCFKNFGDIVKHWFTFNEPWCMAVFEDCKDEERATYPYKLAHNVLVTHAKVVKLYRDNYKKEQEGDISIVLNSDMFYPKDPNKPSDVVAADRALTFMLDWLAEPLFNGDYPESLKAKLGDRLPSFTDEEKQLLKGSIDFFSLNHYSSYLCEEADYKEGHGFWYDRNVSTSFKPEWKRTDTGLAVVPEGLRNLLETISRKYTKAANMPILITENGMANREPTQKEADNDDFRIEFLKGYIENVDKAITEDGVNVSGYFVWSLLDNFEWGSGFTKRFGIVRVELGDVPKRIAKKSFYWYRDFIASNSQQQHKPRTFY